MILVIGGTSDSYHLIAQLQKEGRKITAAVTTDYGKKLLKDKFDLKVIKKRMEKSDLRQLIKKNEIKAVIDASHPFAEEITAKSIAAAEEAEIPYLRYERKELDLSSFQNLKLIKAKNYQEAAKKANDYHKIFLTTGSKNIRVFKDEIDNYQQRLFLRVMTFPFFIKKLIKLGLPPANIIALKGPFSKNFNMALFREYEADVIVSKASGVQGGLKTKIEAAAELKLPLIIIQRPQIDYPLIFNEASALIEYINKNL